MCSLSCHSEKGVASLELGSLKGCLMIILGESHVMNSYLGGQGDPFQVPHVPRWFRKG